MVGLTYEGILSNTFSKQKLKLSASSAAFSFLLNKKEAHKKIKHIKYETLNIQNNLVSELFTTDQANMLTAIISHCLRGIRNNFSNFFQNNLNSPLNCNAESPNIDTQEHVLYCKSLNQTHGEQTPVMPFMYGDIKQQVRLSQKFITLMRERSHILEPQEDEEEVEKLSS